MTPEALKAKIDAGIQWAKENGVTIIADRWGVLEDKCGCALSCAYWAEGGDDDYAEAEQMAGKWGIDLHDVFCFTSGFDGLDISFISTVNAFYALGRTYRERLISST